MDIAAFLADPRVFRVNKLPAHSDHTADGTVTQLLDGVWDALWARQVKDRVEDFYKEDFRSGGFRPIRVPGHAELQGFGGAQYINTLYPWEGKEMLRPPMVPEDNPVVSYVRLFDLLPGQEGKRLVLRFLGVETAMAVYLNGNFVGYSEDSFSPAEFDVTAYARPEQNRLCVEVFKRSSASWLEDQDFFRFSGIFRSVLLLALPDAHIEDFFADSVLEGADTGVLDLTARISSKGAFKGRLSWEVRDGATVLSGRSLQVEGSGQVRFATERFAEITPYSHARPKLYTLQLVLSDSSGREVERVSWGIGFRRLEIRDGVLLLNGRRLILAGVNRHEWSPWRGRAVSEAEMLQDVEILVRNSINAVRTSHYPNHPFFYQLCDERGIYLMSETNLESHGSWQKDNVTEPSWNVPGDREEWFPAVLDRAASNFQTFKNHPSVLFWSLGNESYAGEGIRLMGEYFHEMDRHRLVHYEGVFHRPALKPVISDVEARMYATPMDVRNYFREDGSKPFILSEYMHSMGNSLGGIASYDSLLDEFPGFAGGFLWDFIDQALYSPEGRLLYGGDFSDKCSDYSFCADGLLFADRTEKPCMQEVRHFYADRVR